MTIRATLLAATLALGGCQGFGDIVACEQEARPYMTKVIVQDQVCTTGAGLLGGIVTTCQAVPREAYLETPASREQLALCVGARRFDRNMGPRAVPNPFMPAPPVRPAS